MKRTAVARFGGLAAFSLSGLALWGSPPPVPQAARFDEKRGLIELPEPHSPFVAFNIWVKVGSQNDPPGKEGLAALTAALLAEGSTREDPYESILAKLYPMAAGYSYSVDKEMTVFTGRVHRDNLDNYYALFRNALLSPAFKEEDFARVKSQTMNYLERGRRYGRDEELTKELLFALAYRGTPYEHPEEGYVESVSSITLEDVRDFYASTYLRNNLVVAVGGGYPEGFPSRVRNDFDRLPEGRVPWVPPPRPRTPERVEVLIVEKPTDATPVSIGFPIHLLRGDNDFFDLLVFNSWLGEHRNSFSHLYQVIRERRGMNYGDYSYIEAFPLGYATQQPPVNVARRSQLFEIWLRPISNTTPTDLHPRVVFATRAALRELDRVVRYGLPSEEVERTKQFLWNYTVHWGNTLSRRLAYAVDDVFYGIPAPGYLAQIRPGLERVTPESVREALRVHLRSPGYYLVFITRNARELKDLLVRGAPTPITYPGPQPREILEEDQEIARYPIPVREEDVRILDISQVFQRPMGSAW